MIESRETRPVARLVEYRADDGDAVYATGYAAVFDASTVIGGSFHERVEPGAFDLDGADDVVALVNHDPSLLLGRTASATLALAVDDVGLRYTVRLPGTSCGRDVAELLRRGDLTGSSFAFSVADGGETWTPATAPDELPLRRIEKVHLHDVSIVTHPAYLRTSVALAAEARAWEPTLRPVVGASPGYYRRRLRQRIVEAACDASC